MSEVDTQHPWLGLDSFTEETRAFFHGREEEVAELARRVQRKPLTVLFGQSGLGKTSILRAGIVPRLRPEGYCPVYVRIDYAPDAPPPAEQIKRAIFRATETSGTWTRPGAAVSGESLWEFLHHRDDVLHDASGRTIVPLLIFDQFEEIFTIAQGDDASRERAALFVAELADLVENRPPAALEARIEADETLTERFDFSRADYRVLIALREDYLAHLEGFKGAMPSITQNRMRLARMTGQQALAAVLRPGGRLVSQEVAESIVRFTAGGSELSNAEVEPSLLSLICRELNNARIAQGRAEISADLLAGSHDTILNEFYERALADQPPALRLFVEEQLLTESGYRESLAEERILKGFEAAGVASAADALATLVNRRLLRIEERLDLRRVELTHDVLCPIVAASRAARHAREGRERAERELEAQRARETATRQALRRARQIATGCALLALIAIAAGTYGYLGMMRAQKAEERAQYVRSLADSARGESERLIIYLLDDFYRELEPIGRLELMGELARRAVEYYDSLPLELQTTEANRNRALAQVRFGAVMRNQAKLEQAQASLDEAIATLEDLHAKGDDSEATATGIALGLTARAKVMNSRGDMSDAKVPATRAAEVLRPIAEAPGASISARRNYGAVLTVLGFLQLRTGEETLAVSTLETARAMYRGIADLALSDTDAAANFSSTTAWLLEALTLLERHDEGRRAGAEAGAIADAILEQQPANMQALRASQLIAASLADIEAQEFRLENALVLAQKASERAETLTRVDPGNSVAFNNLGAALWAETLMRTGLGRPGEALAQLERSRVLEPMGAESTMVAGIVAGLRSTGAWLAAELGDLALAKRLDEESWHYERILRAGMTPGSFALQGQERFVDVIQIELAIARGELDRARSQSKGLADRIGSLATADAAQAEGRDALLIRLHTALAELADRRSDPAGAEAEAHRAMALFDRVPVRTTRDRRSRSRATIVLAIAQARQGRLEQARQTLAPALALQQDGFQRNADDQTQRLEYAMALYAASLADPGAAAARLAEARRIHAELPADFRAMRSTRYWGQRLAAASGD